MEIPDRLFPFRDRQQAPVCGFCPICGREIYNIMDELCWDCQARAEADDNECD